MTARREFFNASGVLADPSTVFFRTRSPAGDEKTYVYGAGVVARLSTGVYSLDFYADYPKRWSVRAWGADGGPLGVEEQSVTIDESPFTGMGISYEKEADIQLRVTDTVAAVVS
jgi:hypothetical protein